MASSGNLNGTDWEKYLSARQTKLIKIATAPVREALALWLADEDDWAAALVLAARTDLSKPRYTELLLSNSWPLRVALCHNSALPLRLLRRLAKVSAGSPPPEADDCECFKPDHLVRIARAALRKRLVHKK